jgi:hypothetical protein
MTAAANDITLIDLVAERIGGQVDALVGSIEFIAELQALMDQGGLPQREVGAFVVPLGFDDRGGESAVGMHTQMLADAIGVVLYVKSRGDLKAKKALPRIEPLINQVVDAVAGWTPGNTSGVFHVKRGRLLPGGNGIIVYTIDFELLDQLRIAT